MKWDFKISNGTVDEAIEIMSNLPEFHSPLKTKTDIESQLVGRKHQILIAKRGNSLVGFKLAYDQENGVLYSWLGGVLPSYRKNGIAKELAKIQEEWALQNGFTKIRFKTLHKHKAMLSFAHNNQFEIMHIDESGVIPKIILEKKLV